jgi:hypothetical protein
MFNRQNFLEKIEVENFFIIFKLIVKVFNNMFKIKIKMSFISKLLEQNKTTQMKCFKFENSNKSCTQWQYDRQEFVSINTEVSY